MTRFFSFWRQSALLEISSALALGFLIFPAWLVVGELVLGVVIWRFMGTHSHQTSWKGVVWLFWICFSLLLLSRLAPFFFFSAPLGYDTGIYRYELWSSFQAVPDYASQLFLGLPLLTNVFQLFGVSVEGIMSWSYVFVVLLVPLSMVLLSDRMWGRETSLFVVFLFLISLLQWKAFTMVFYKQVLAIALSFYTIFLLEKRSWLVLVSLPFVALLQPLDALLVGVSYGFYAFFASFSSVQTRSYFLGLMLCGGVAMGGLLLLDGGFWKMAWDLFSQGIFYPEVLENSLRSGAFLSLYDYGYQSAFLFVFGMMGFVLDWKASRRLSLLGWYFCTVFAWISFGLFFYERLLIHLDAILILFSAFSFFAFARAFARDRWGKILLVFIVLGLLTPMMLVFYRFEPSVKVSELEAVQDFCKRLPPHTYVAATDSFYGPWLRGYCLEQRVFGPGLFVDNRWSYPEWQRFWAGDREAISELLSRYESEVYFYRGEHQFQLEFDPELFQWVEGGWWRRVGDDLKE